MDDNCSKEMTGDLQLCLNTNINENQENNCTLVQYPENDDVWVDPQVDQIEESQQEMKTILCPLKQLDESRNLQECLKQEFQNQGCNQTYQKQFYICESCNNSLKPEKQHMVYWEKDGALYWYSNNIYSLNAEEVKAIQCPHNYIDLKLLSNNDFGINLLQNSNIEQILREILQLFFQISDVSICKICISYNNPEDVDQYILYLQLGGVTTKDPNDIYLYNPGEVLAISCPHNQIYLKNFSKDFGHILLRKYPKTFDTFFKDNPRIFKKYFIKFGIQGHFKIQYFNILCEDEKQQNSLKLSYIPYQKHPKLILRIQEALPFQLTQCTTLKFYLIQVKSQREMSKIEYYQQKKLKYNNHVYFLFIEQLNLIQFIHITTLIYYFLRNFSIIRNFQSLFECVPHYGILEVNQYNPQKQNVQLNIQTQNNIIKFHSSQESSNDHIQVQTHLMSCGQGTYSGC